MLRAEPKTILNFLSDRFEFMLQLLALNKSDGLIQAEKLHKICKAENIDEKKLEEYKIIKEISGGDFELRKPYENFFNFILEDYKLDLPENIRKYYNSIEEIYEKMLGEENKLSQQKLIAGMVDEVQAFIETIESNTRSLLNESKELKANIQKIEYIEKINRASYLIDFYIDPLNRIRDANHTGSVIFKLGLAREHANDQRINHEDFFIRAQYEKLYNQIISANIELVRNSKILTKELLPLLEKIKTESQILSGFIEFLKKPNKYNPPKTLIRRRHAVYDPDAFFSAKDIFEQFVAQEDLLIGLDSNDTTTLPWVFDRVKFKRLVSQSLPVSNYFDWCNSLMEQEAKDANDFEKFFAIGSLIFEPEFRVQFDDSGARTEIKFKDISLDVPVIHLEKLN